MNDINIRQKPRRKTYAYFQDSKSRKAVSVTIENATPAQCKKLLQDAVAATQNEQQEKHPTKSPSMTGS